MDKKRFSLLLWLQKALPNAQVKTQYIGIVKGCGNIYRHVRFLQYNSSGGEEMKAADHALKLGFGRISGTATTCRFWPIGN